MASATADEFTLSGDSSFQHRVQEAAVATAIAVTTEATTVAFHVDRARFAEKVLLNPSGYAALFAMGVATDSAVQTDAGVGTGTVNQANVTDQHILNALSSDWDSYAEQF